MNELIMIALAVGIPVSIVFGFWIAKEREEKRQLKEHQEKSERMFRRIPK